MNLRRAFLCVLLLLSFTICASASEISIEQKQAWKVDSLETGMQPQTQELMDDFKPDENSNFFQSVLSVFKEAVSKSGNAFKSAVSTVVRVLLIVVLCQLVDSVCYEKGQLLVVVAGTLTIVVCCSSDLKTMIGLGKSTIQEITDYSSLLLPVMVSAATASGALTGAGVAYTVTTFFLNLLMKFSNGIMVPLLYTYLALSVTDTVIQQQRLKKIRELIGWLIEKGLKGIVYVFTGILSITGMLTSSADTATLKAAKATISGVVPVVGSMISGAADSVFASAVLLKNAIGTFGMLAIFSAFILPFLNMGISYILFKISAAVGGVFGSKLGGLLEAITSVLGYFLAMIASCALIGILSCCCFIRTVSL